MITIRHADVTGGEIMNYKLTHIDREASVLEASKLMRKAGTTEFLVTDKSEGILHPLGVVTARDIVTRTIAAELDPAVITAGDIAESGTTAHTAKSDAGSSWRSPEHPNEALAVLDDEGLLIGTLRLDEIDWSSIYSN